jgi:6,7-dimethyl-8-ribityllumazine synthase
MRVPLSLQPDARGLRVGLVVSRYHDSIVDRLAEGAAQAFRRAGGDERDLMRVDSPGTFELPVIAAALLRRGDVSAVVALGLVLTGETTHDRYISDSVAHGLMELAIETGKPAAFGVLTCQTLAQAEARAGGAKGNKGEEAMAAAILAAVAIEAARDIPARRRSRSGQAAERSDHA